MNAPVGDGTEVRAQFRLLTRTVVLAFGGGMVAALLVARVVSAGAPLFSAATPELVLYPCFAMFLLVALVLVRMGWLRIGGVLGGTVSLRFYRTFDDGEEPAHMRVVTRNFINLFEMPMLFYVVVLMAYVSQQVSYWMIGLAWVYVALRYLHSAVHVTSNDVATRLSFYASSGLVLLTMWGTLFVALVTD